MKYERLTKKGGLNFADENLSLADECGYSHIYKRLAELEDKIEHGTLIELPTQEFVFHISKSKNGNYVVRKISKYYYMSVYACTCGVMREWFATREKAEKRLKELQE